MRYNRQSGVRLAELDRLVDWERFRDRLELVAIRDGVSPLGRRRNAYPADDVLVIFRSLLYGILFGIADDEELAEAVDDRWSARQFARIDRPDGAPSARSLGLHERLWEQSGVLYTSLFEVDEIWRRAGHPVAEMQPFVESIPVRIGWIVDAQTGFFDGQGPRHVVGAEGPVEVEADEAVDTLTRAAARMAACCQVMVYTQRATDGDGPGADDLIPSVRPPGALVLESDASEKTASEVAIRALGEGRHVVWRRPGDAGLEGSGTCGMFLAAWAVRFMRPTSILVAGCAFDGSLGRVVDGLRSHGHRVDVVRDAVFTMGGGDDRRDAAPVPRESGAVSMHDLHDPLDRFRQISFADVQIAGAYERIDSRLGASPDFVPLVRLDEAVPWELFRSRLDVSRRARRTDIGSLVRSDWNDPLVVFKSLLLGAVYDLSDKLLALLLDDRLTFRRFAGLGLTTAPPTAQQLRLHRNRWKKAGVMGELAGDVAERWARTGCSFQGMRRLLGGSAPGAGQGGEAGVGDGSADAGSGPAASPELRVQEPVGRVKGPERRVQGPERPGGPQEDAGKKLGSGRKGGSEKERGPVPKKRSGKKKRLSRSQRRKRRKKGR